MNCNDSFQSLELSPSELDHSSSLGTSSMAGAMTQASKQLLGETAFSVILQSTTQSFRALWATRWTSLSVVLGGGVIGAAIALLIPNQYTSSAAFIAQGAQTLALPAVLQGAAASLGLERGSDYSPKFYADMLTSRPVLQ